MHHVRFGDDFVLHPRSFALASTIEWLRIPTDLAGYVTGRSSLGRRGLIIATAVGVHPGFTGCLTLELSNLGDVPIIIRPGMTVAQLFLHAVEGATESESVDRSAFYCKRRPVLGELVQDDVALAIAKGFV
jgi:dCTP deaminase